MESFFQHPASGFRFSQSDLLVLILTTIGAAILWKTQLELSLLVLFVVAHFFLFCNVFRIRRNQELIWTAIFIAQFFGLQFIVESWLWSFGFQVPITAIFLYIETGHSSYHGSEIFSRVK